jgi:hypothetical protein
MSNARQRDPETPSHGGGLTESGLQRLEEYRRQRDQRKGAFQGVDIRCPIDLLSRGYHCC